MMVEFLQSNWALKWFQDNYGDDYIEFIKQKGPINSVGAKQSPVLLVHFFNEKLNRIAMVQGHMILVYFEDDEETFLRLKYE